jgi:hypothetical protein
MTYFCSSTFEGVFLFDDPVVLCRGLVVVNGSLLGYQPVACFILHIQVPQIFSGLSCGLSTTNCVMMTCPWCEDRLHWTLGNLQQRWNHHTWHLRSWPSSEILPLMVTFISFSFVSIYWNSHFSFNHVHTWCLPHETTFSVIRRNLAPYTKGWMDLKPIGTWSCSPWFCISQVPYNGGWMWLKPIGSKCMMIACVWVLKLNSMLCSAHGNTGKTNIFSFSILTPCKITSSFYCSMNWWGYRLSTLHPGSTAEYSC